MVNSLTRVAAPKPDKQAGGIDLLSFIADDRQIVTYRPRWNQITGSITATILLQQIIYRWIQSGRRPFYKFTAPCSHHLYRPGDSWEEELGMTRREFDSARGHIAKRTGSEEDPEAIVSYWVTAGHLTWYTVNEEILLRRLADIYPQTQPDAAEPFDKSANGYHRDGQSHSTNPPMAMSDKTEPMADLSNAIRQIRQQKNIDIHIDNKGEAKTTAAEAPASPAAVAVLPRTPPTDSDPTDAILRWIEFGDRLTPEEREVLDPAMLLAWAYWVFLEKAGVRPPKNPIGLARAQWRKGVTPRDDLLALARAWQSLPVDGRAVLLEDLDFSARYGYDDDLEASYPSVPIATAIAVYRATGGRLAPPSLSPRALPSRAEPLAAPPAEPASASIAGSDLWRVALEELESQMSRATFANLLSGSSAVETAAGIAVHVRNAQAVEWLTNRLHPVVQRVVDSLAGRPLPVRYLVREENHEAI